MPACIALYACRHDRLNAARHGSICLIMPIGMHTVLKQASQDHMGTLPVTEPSKAGVESVRFKHSELLLSWCTRCCQNTEHEHQYVEPFLPGTQLSTHTSGRVLQGTKPPKVDSEYSEDERREPFRELLREALPDQDAATNEEVASLSGTQLRDRLIAHKPLDRDWIARVNQVIAAEWDVGLLYQRPCLIPGMGYVLHNNALILGVYISFLEIWYAAQCLGGVRPHLFGERWSQGNKPCVL